jgi:hypothetical protein
MRRVNLLEKSLKVSPDEKQASATATSVRDRSSRSDKYAPPVLSMKDRV